MGWLTGHNSAGAIAAGGAFMVGFAVFNEALSSVLLSMTAATLGIASATLIGSLAAPWTPLVLLVAFVAAVNYGLLGELGPTAGWIGQQSAVFAIIASYFARGPHYALARTAMVLLGGSLQIFVFWVFYELRPRKHKPGTRKTLERILQRLREIRQDLSDELTVRHHSAIYVVRLSLVLLTSTALYRYFDVRNGYWIPMTAVLVVKPQWGHTLSRGIARMLGTVAGAGFLLLLNNLLPFPEWLLPALVLVSTWGCYSLLAVNYAVFSFFITLYIVFLFRFGGFADATAAQIRLENTVVGGSLALVIDWMWNAISTRWSKRAQSADSVQ
jgi:hypothetical protein